MTSASSKVNTSLFSLFINSHRDIMPACVATSFPRISSDVYNRDYVRDDRGSPPGSSFSESSGYEDYNNNQFPISPADPDRLGKTSSQLIDSPRSKSEGDPSKTVAIKTELLEKNLPVAKNKSDSNNCDERTSSKNQCKKRKYSPENHEASGAENISISSVLTHPLKKRFFQTGDEESKEMEKGVSSTINSKSPSKSNVKLDGSSDILQQMYNSFGKNINGHLAKCHFSESMKGLNRDHTAAENFQSPEKNGQRSHTAEDQRLHHQFQDAPRLKLKEPPQKNFNYPPENSTKTKDHKRHDINKQTNNKYSCHGGSLKSKKEKTNLKKRKYSTESYKVPAVPRDQLDASSSHKQSKRSRFPSSESNDSQSKQTEKEGSDFCPQENPWFPFFNPMFYPQAALGNFGIPTPGFSLPGISPPNPLMFSTNPYFSNPVLMRDMMASARMSHLLPLFSNANFSPCGVGFSPQQIQAIQQLQSSFYQNSNSLFPSGNYHTNQSIFPAMQPISQLANGQKFKDLNQPGAERRSCDSVACPTSKNSSLNKPPKGFSETSGAVSQFPTFSSSKIQKPQIDQIESYNHCKDEKAKMHKRVHPNKSHNYLNSKKEEKSRAVPQPKQHRTNPSALKRRGEKKAKDPTKSKEIRNEKLAPDVARSDQFEKLSKEKPEEPNERNSPPTGTTGSAKSPSYKNLTRERRLVANARERTRVHTISSAFDELRGQIPSYSCNQKLSKLAILRIACEYIRTLSVLAGHDETLTLGQGVDRCTRVLQSESRARSRRKNNKAQIEWEMANYDRHKPPEEVELLDETVHHSSSAEGSRQSVSVSDDPVPPDSASAAASPTVERSTNDVPDYDVIENHDELVDVESIDDEKLETISNVSS